jgi:hypothetical protein
MPNNITKGLSNNPINTFISTTKLELLNDFMDYLVLKYNVSRGRTYHEDQ